MDKVPKNQQKWPGAPLELLSDLHKYSDDKVLQVGHKLPDDVEKVALKWTYDQLKILLIASRLNMKQDFSRVIHI